MSSQPPDTKSKHGDTAVKAGIGFGSALAIAISWMVNKLLCAIRNQPGKD